MSAPAGAAQTLLARGLSVLILLVLASIIWPPISDVVGLVGLLLLIPALVIAGTRTRIVAILITAIGLACAVAAAMLGVLPSLGHTEKLNQDLIAMLAGGAFVGLTLSHSRGHMWRAMLEAVSFGFRHHLDVLRDIGNVCLHIVTVAGLTEADARAQAAVQQREYREIHP